MMSITITLTPDQEQKLAEFARQSGKDPSVYVHDVVTAYLNGAGPKGVKTFEENLALHLGRLATEWHDGSGDRRPAPTRTSRRAGGNGISGKGGCESAKRAGSRSRLHGVRTGGIAAGRSIRKRTVAGRGCCLGDGTRCRWWSGMRNTGESRIGSRGSDGPSPRSSGPVHSFSWGQVWPRIICFELFGEALEMTGMSPYPHYAFVQKGEVDPDFLRSRLNILVIEYPRGEHEHVTAAIEQTG